MRWRTLYFSPHTDGEESLLDSAIDCLVKPRLARIDVDPVGPREYVYHRPLAGYGSGGGARDLD
jgi:hypothetical protein